MKSDMIAKIVSALNSVPRHVGTEGSYEEVDKDFEVVASSGEDKKLIMWRDLLELGLVSLLDLDLS